MTVAQMIRKELDELRADGLMRNGMLSIAKENIENTCNFYYEFVPAYRHADGTYHTEKEPEYPCTNCKVADEGCGDEEKAPQCPAYQSWLSHKEETK